MGKLTLTGERPTGRLHVRPYVGSHRGTVELDIIHKSGSSFSYNGEKLAQGRDAVKQLLRDNKELCDEIEAKIREEMAKIND